MSLKIETYNRVYASILTVVVMGLLFLFALLFIFRTPLPPFEEGGGGGVAVNFGTSETGFGDAQNEQYLPIETTVFNNTSSQTKTAPSADNNEKILTQSSEDAPAVASSEKQVNKQQTQVVTPQIKISTPVVNTAAMYKKKTGGQGITQGNGDQGKPNGDPNSTNYNGDGGNGTGKGPGTGPGIGDGNGPGKGISFSLKGRKNLSLPKPDYNSIEQGKVVVLITVDKEGNVTKAVAGQPGSTTTNLGLMSIAEKAAMKSKFDANPNAAEEQKGSITYIFLKQN